jgi:hypothetical protein
MTGRAKRVRAPKHAGARRPGMRGSFLASLGLHAVLVAILFAGAPGPSRHLPKNAKVYTVNLASLPRAASGPAPALEAKGLPPRPTTVRQKKPPPEETKPKVNLEKPKPKPKPKQEKKPETPAPPIKSEEPATKAVAPAPEGSPQGAERTGGPGLGLPSGGSGIGLSGAGTDTDFPFTYYLVAVRNKIAAYWAPPSGVSAGGAPLRRAGRAILGRRVLRPVGRARGAGGNAAPAPSGGVPGRVPRGPL